MVRWITLVLVVLCCMILQPAQAEDAVPAPASASEQEDNAGMYAMLDSTNVPEPGPIARAMHRFAPFANSKVAVRPMVLWYHWANQRKPFIPSFLFLLFTSIVVSSVIPNWVQSAQVHSRSRFWRTFFVGALVSTIVLVSVRMALVTMAGWALAVVLLGAYQLALLAGLTVMVVLIGQSVCYYLKADKWAQRPDVRRLAALVIGALICAALLQIPGIGILPRIGTRLLAMMAIVGLGALYRARGREPNASHAILDSGK